MLKSLYEGVSNFDAKYNDESDVNLSLVALAFAGILMGLLIVHILPAEAINLTGNLEHRGSQLRVGGSIAVIALLGLAMPYMVGQFTRSEHKAAIEASLGQSLKAAFEEQARNYTDLTRSIYSKDDDLLRIILDRGYYRQSLLGIEVNCKDLSYARRRENPEAIRVTAAYRGKRNDLPIHIPYDSISEGLAEINIGAPDFREGKHIVKITLALDDRGEPKALTPLNVVAVIEQEALNEFCVQSGKQKALDPELDPEMVIQ